MSAKKTTCKEDSGTAGRRENGKNATITIINGCFAGLVIKLEKEKTTLGRNIGCDVCLDHSHISDEHAIIRMRGGDFVLEDLGSRRGTRLNGNPVHREELRTGDLISIGEFELKFTC